MNIEEEKFRKAVKELRDSYELHLRRWAERCLQDIEIAYEKEKEKNKELEKMIKKDKDALQFKVGDIVRLKYKSPCTFAIEVIDERELISKDKIKEILGIEENIDNEKLLSLLQTIVDENSRLEDIEDRKVQIEYNNVFNKGVKSVEDKIKAKIEEVDIQLQKLKDGLTGRKTNFVNKNMLFAQKKVLQSLLEKE